MAAEPSPPAYVPGARSEVRRGAARARYDRDTVHAILDEGLVAHLAFTAGAQPLVVPTIYARVGEVLYVHGSSAARWLRGRKPRPVCLVVTLLDGLVLARSAFHHSMNYRSVVVFGRARPVRDPAEKAAAFEALVEHVVPGRSREARPANARELARTAVAAIEIEEASAKVRSGDPIDDAEDLELPIWAGTLPLRLVPGAPQPDAALPAGLEAPAYVTGYARSSSNPTPCPPEARCASASSATPTTTCATSGGSSSS